MSLAAQPSEDARTGVSVHPASTVRGMQLGMLTPIQSLEPGVYADWEVDAGIDDLRAIAQRADELGYAYLTCSQHTAIPVGAELPGERYYDPLATFGYLAACTDRIRLATSVVVLPYHHPLQIAKSFGTLDRVSGGRLVLGVGVGYLAEEFDLLGAPFDDRGARADDAIRALRAAFGRRLPEYHGEFYDFEQMIVDPHGLQAPPPIWVGGMSRRSLRRAVELGDGWCPFGVSMGDVAAWLGDAADTEAWAARERRLDVVVTRGPLDPLGDPDKAASVLERAGQAGATKVSVVFSHTSRAHLLEQMAALRALVDEGGTV
jgi:probable F420-dependent oxidoreductase